MRENEVEGEGEFTPWGAREKVSMSEVRGGSGGGDWARYDPERLAVYRLARRHTRAVGDLLRKADMRGHADLADDLRRTAKSATANIKEGYGEHRPAKKINYYQIAKASITEAWGHLDTMVDFRLYSPDGIAEIRDLQNQIIALLITMIRNLEARVRKAPPKRRNR